MPTEAKRAAGSAGFRGSGRARPSSLAALIVLAGLAAAVPAWARWPWQHRPAAASTQKVDVLAVSAGSAAPGTSPAPAAGKVPIAQFWDRNTLLLDLTHLSGSGSATLMPVSANGGWPVRLEFRVQPGTIARLQVMGEQRVTFIVPAQGAAEVLKLDPGVYLADTAQINLRWTAAGDLPR